MQEKADLGKGSVTYPFPVFETEKRGKTLNYTRVQSIRMIFFGDCPVLADKGVIRLWFPFL